MMHKCDVHYGNVRGNQHSINSTCNALALFEHRRAKPARPAEFKYLESVLADSSGSQPPTRIIGYTTTLLQIKKSSSVTFRPQACTAAIYSTWESEKEVAEDGHFSHFGALSLVKNSMSGAATDMIIVQAIIFLRSETLFGRVNKCIHFKDIVNLVYILFTILNLFIAIFLFFLQKRTLFCICRFNQHFPFIQILLKIFWESNWIE